MKYLGIILFSFFLSACNGQTKSDKSSNYTETIKSQAETMRQLMLKEDFSAFAKFTYPKVIEMMGGKEKMVEVMKRGSQQMESEGTKFLNVTIGEPSKIITTGSELQCTLPQTIEMKVANGKLITKSTLIAISTNNGKNWYFLDTSGKNIQTMHKILPNLSTELVISDKKEPTFHKD